MSYIRPGRVLIDGKTSHDGYAIWSTNRQFLQVCVFAHAQSG